MDYALELLKRDLASKVKPGSIFVFEHPDFAEENELKIQSLKDAIEILSVPSHETPKVGNNEKAKEVCTFSRNCNKKTTDNKCEFTGSCPHKKVPTG